jgi:hypothetical protein
LTSTAAVLADPGALSADHVDAGRQIHVDVIGGNAPGLLERIAFGAAEIAFAHKLAIERQRIGDR